MSNDNFAIDIDDDPNLDPNVDDQQNELSTSRCALMSFEEEQPVSFVASIKESVRSSKRKISYYTSFITSPIKKLLSTFKLLIIIALYSFLGAHLFMYYEVSADLAAKEESYHQRKIARENMILNLRAIYYDNRQDHEERWKHAILRFENELDLDEPVIETAWTFWMSFLYAGTIFTTIGYGNIACKTTSGQVATMIYAFAGIPIMLVMLNSLNNFLLKWIKIIANYTSDTILYLGIKFGIITIRQHEKEKLKRYRAYLKKYRLQKVVMSNLTESGINNQGEHVSIDMLSKDEEEDEDDEEIQPDPPVISTIFATVAWIMLSAMIFCMFEDWSFFTSFYFCFISLTTIGLGDVTPANPEYMIATFGVVIIGLSMLTVCIDVVKEKIALMYMAILQKLLKDYMEALENGDPNAASAMMAGFQGKAKFLMPLLSKNDGTKVMNKFKQDCSKKGIDPPPVLTNINPETGMPAFATAQREDFNDYIEVAEELAAEEKNQVNMSKSSIEDLLNSRKNSMMVPKMAWENNSSKRQSIISEIAKITMDEATQTIIMDIFDIGVQAKIEKTTCDSETQYIVTSCHTIGIQPEVSSIYHYNPLFSDSSESCSENEDESETSSENETDIDMDFETEQYSERSKASQKSQSVKNSPIHSDLSKELVADEIILEQNILVGKSEDLSSQNDQQKSDIAIREKIIKPERKTKKRKKIKKHASTVLRFLKNSGMQTEVFKTNEESTQYEEIEKSNRRCQTKMSSIPKGMMEKRKRNLTIDKGNNRNYILEQKIGEQSLENIEENGEIINEVNLDVHLISLGVDEVGHVVDVPFAKESIDREISSISSITLSSDDEDFDEIEFLFKNSSMQTEDLETCDKESHATPISMNMISDSITQTTISTFRRPSKKLLAETSEKMAEPENNEKKDEIHYMEEIGVQTRQTSFYNKKETSFDKTEKNKETMEESTVEESEIPLFLTDIETQTSPRSENQFGTQTLKLDVSEIGLQTDYISPKIVTENEKQVDLQNVDIQTDFQNSCVDQSEQTDIPNEKLILMDQSNQADLKNSQIDIHVQTELETKINFGLQVSLGKECEDRGNQVNMKPNIEDKQEQTETFESKVEVKDFESQAEICLKPDVSDKSYQTEIVEQKKDIRDFEIQTEFECSTKSEQTESVEVANSGVQVEIKCEISMEDQIIQTNHLEVQDFEGQIDIKPDCSNKSEQTNILEQKDSEVQVQVTTSVENQSQTENPDFVDSNIQVRIEIQKSVEDRINQTEQVEVQNLQIQTEVQALKSSSQQTEWDDPQKQDAENQAGSGHCIVASCATQHEFEEYQADKYCQAEVQTKNKRCQNDEDFFAEEEKTESPSPPINFGSLATGPLWSDFDYIHEDEEVIEGEHETEDENQTETGIVIKSEVTTKTEKWLTVPKNESEKMAKKILTVSGTQSEPKDLSHALIQTISNPTTSSTVQAVAETCDMSSGLIGNDDWLQVYVQELDEERRLRMSDIGIQTGVLARVQHMYTRPISDDVEGTSLTPITLRKSSESSEPSGNNLEGSQESLLVSTATARSAEDPGTPSTSLQRKSSNPQIRRTKSLKKVRLTGDPRKTKSEATSNIVNDLRAKFEGGPKLE
ncbi:unnamed protein product [Caenorhabditis angaria]|uniref:Potassium channel domain-containing protein n=1 Tax=Caenorhabditis angaria TaxID=860376 RepID=A0A9P1IW11_9PELO|nr:unnamed protein product [Caenorhabditis angaria]